MKINKLLFYLGTLFCPGKIIDRLYSVPDKFNSLKNVTTFSFDIDYTKDTENIPEILVLLKKYNVKASFACIGTLIEKYPRIYKNILEEGHEIINHTYSHPSNKEFHPDREFIDIGKEEQEKQIFDCHKVCKKILNYMPRGFRIPHFKINPTDTIYEFLNKLGYEYSSSTLAINSPNGPFPFRTLLNIYEFPVAPCPIHPFTLFDTYHAFRSKQLIYKIKPHSHDEFRETFKSFLNIRPQDKLYFNFYFDPMDLNYFDLEGILEYASGLKDRMEILTYSELVELISGSVK